MVGELAGGVTGLQVLCPAALEQVDPAAVGDGVTSRVQAGDSHRVKAAALGVVGLVHPAELRR